MANIGSGLIKIDVTWTELKAFVTSKSLSIQYDQDDNGYDLMLIDGIIVYYTRIFIGPVPDFNWNQTQNDIDLADFENNYKDQITNQPITASPVLSGVPIANISPTLIAGSDSVNTVKIIKTNMVGALKIDASDYPISLSPSSFCLNTYSASIESLTVTSSPTDIFTIIGSSSKVIKIRKVYIGGYQTSANRRDILFLKRCSLNSGGAYQTITPVKYDTYNPNSVATVKYYTSNPSSLGTLVGKLWAFKLYIGNVNANTNDVLYEFGTTDTQPIILREDEVFAINLNGVTSSGNKFSISVEWTEQ